MSVVTTTTTMVIKTVEDVAVLPKNAEDVIKAYNDAKAGIKALEKQKAEAEATLREMLNGANTGVIEGVERLKVSHRTRTGTDTEALKTVFPEAYEATLTKTDYTVLTTK